MPVRDAPLRVFISSTAQDLAQHRAAISGVLLRLGVLPVAMETFGAQPDDPVSVSLQEVRRCDALIVVLGHRLGFIPTVDQGGDGSKSLTWMEVETALKEQIAVFAFLVDPSASWAQLTEQDALLDVSDEAAAVEVFARVRTLNSFRSFLQDEAGLTRDVFDTPEDLAVKVSTALSMWIGAKGVSTSRHTWHVWQYHALKPCQSLRGRREEVTTVAAWLRRGFPNASVLALTGIGGTGKTSLLRHALDRLSPTDLHGDVFVWSFYDDPNAGAFQQAAARFFGARGTSKGVSEEDPRSALAEGPDHLLVLDGLEVVQSDGRDGTAIGTIRDHGLKGLLRSIANGLGSARAVVTSRLPLVDLVPWVGQRVMVLELGALDPMAAVQVLRDWGVKGTQDQLMYVARECGFHGLTLSLLGSYLAHVADGSVMGTPSLDVQSPDLTEWQAVRLSRVLEYYEASLSSGEREVLMRLVAYPSGVALPTMDVIATTGVTSAGSLLTPPEVRRCLRSLVAKGLVRAQLGLSGEMLSVHPFVSQFWSRLLLEALPMSGATAKEAIELALDRTGSRGPGVASSPVSRGEDTVVVRTVASLYSHLLTRATGRAIRIAVESHILEAWRPGERILSTLDLSEVTALDFSAADEIVPGLLQRFPWLYVVLTGVSDVHRDVLSTALEARKQAVTVIFANGTVGVLGPVSSSARQLWRIVERHGLATMDMLPGGSTTALSELLESRLVFQSSVTGGYHALSRLAALATR